MAARIDEFLIGVKPQREWGWLVISYLFLGGAGAGLYLISIPLDHAWAGALGLSVLLLGTLLLFLDLGRPERFWRAFFRPHSSWISRGCFFITLLVLFGGLELIVRRMEIDGLPFAGDGALRIFVKTVAIAAAFSVMIYTGFVLSPSPAIPFWNSALFPIIFLVYSLLAGADILLLASPLLPGASVNVLALERVQYYLVLVCFVLVLSHLSVMSSSASAARESTRLLTRGRWAGLFLGGVVGAGMILPLLLAWAIIWKPYVATVFVFTATLSILRLFGDYLFRFLVIRAGLYDPLL